MSQLFCNYLVKILTITSTYSVLYIFWACCTVSKYLDPQGEMIINGHMMVGGTIHRDYFKGTKCYLDLPKLADHIYVSLHCLRIMITSLQFTWPFNYRKLLSTWVLSAWMLVKLKNKSYPLNKCTWVPLHSSLSSEYVIDILKYCYFTSWILKDENTISQYWSLYWGIWTNNNNKFRTLVWFGSQVSSISYTVAPPDHY